MDLINPPENLQLIRNDYEHFESRLDKWAINSQRKFISDLNMGGGISGLETVEELRNLEGVSLKFWGNSLDLIKLVEWVDSIAMVFIKEETKN